ncbi:fatty acid hydroxylase superfamily-domain-containing protein [Hyaloraphidium curvatum]|nr:fatty acid hydroxylase superfamily-domain-containing protein [Hyaloraphidium curvatum]
MAMPKPRQSRLLDVAALAPLRALLHVAPGNSSAAAPPAASDLVPLSALLTSVVSVAAGVVVAWLSPLWAAFGELTWAEWGTVVLPPLAYWAYSLFLTVVPPLVPGFAERYRLNSTTERVNRVTPGEVARTVVVQHMIQMTVALAVAVLTRGQGKPDTWPVAIGKMAVGAFVLDAYEYWIHRWMHVNPYLYRTIHSVHHRLTTSYSFGALYNHPLEGLLLDTIGGGLASLVTFMNPETACLFYVLSTLKTVDDHCGYVWPWMRLFGNHAGYHDVHHWKGGGKFNFSQPYFTFWDDLCGTRWTGPSPSYVGPNPPVASDPGAKADPPAPAGKEPAVVRTLRSRTVKA